MAIASMAARREQLEASIQRMKDLMKQLDAAQTKKDKQAIRMLIKKQRVLADPAFTVGKEVAFVSPWPETSPVVIDLSDSEDDASDSDDMEL
ncbi:hypothetical protein BV25DRAFT_1241415 [Artomyces pyxidatus]|uniref:Uncharacterized protein n=1 Tax=Artomyces pyxidatus TaxID=48021 RepID=A0ACB8TEB8_9AGAM|nr:hypothetical protein BV25DRAFT_1241415 [Artomyces pyxidatus]